MSAPNTSSSEALDVVTMDLGLGPGGAGWRQLVEASAGTGKTFTLTQVVLRLVVEEGLGVEQVLLLTFTEAATAEIRERLRARLSAAERHVRAVQLQEAGDGSVAPDSVAAVRLAHDLDADDVLLRLAAQWKARGVWHTAASRLALAVASIDLAPIHTIHAWCQRVLREHGVALGVPLQAQLDTGADAVYRQVARTVYRRLTRELPLAWHALAKPNERRLAAIVKHAAGPVPPIWDPESVPEVSAAGWHAAFSQVQRAREACEAAAADGAVQTLVQAMVGWRTQNAVSKTAIRVTAWQPEVAEERIEELQAWWRGAGAPTYAKHLADQDGSLPCFLKKFKGTAHPAPDVGRAIADLLEAEADLAAASDALSLAVHRHIAAVGAAAVQAAQADRTLFFADLLRLVREAVEGPAGPQLTAALAQSFPVALVDEFQDTDAAQWAIFDAIYKGRGRLLLVGDPKQAIYGFRGADVHTYLAARATVSRRHHLACSFRTDRPLVEAFHRLYTKNETPFSEERIGWETIQAAHAGSRVRGLGAPGDTAPKPLRFRRADDGDGLTLAELTAREAVRILGEGGVRLVQGESERPARPDDIAVLVASHQEAADVAEALRLRGVPAVRRDQRSVLQSEACRDVLRLLSAVLQPNDRGVVKAVLAARWVGLNAAELVDLDEDDAAWQAHTDRLRNWQLPWRSGRGTVVQVVQGALDRCMARVLDSDGGARWVTDVRHLLEVLRGVEHHDGVGPVALLDWLRQQRAAAAAGEASDETQMRLDRDDHAVQVITMHGSKGLEFPIVLLPSLRKKPNTTLTGSVAQIREGERTVLVLDPDKDQVGLYKLAAQAERERLVYVALTRAKHLAVVILPTDLRANADAPMQWWFGKHASGKDAGPMAPWTGLEDFCEAHQDVVVYDTAPVGQTLYQPLAEATGLRAPRRFTRELSVGRRLTSFTRLTSHKAHGAVNDPETPDHDHVAFQAPTVMALPEGESSPLPFASFPRGAGAGTAVHAVFEHVDFQAVASSEATVKEQLTRHGFDAELWTADVLAMLTAVCDTPMWQDGARLGDVSAADRLDELGFLLPVARRDALPVDLAAAIRTHGPPELAGYADQVAALAGEAIDGLLVGFVDLIFRHEGRYYVVDYKTNHLGDDPEAYTPDRLTGAMAHSHYILQALIYAVAVVRHLRDRVPGWDGSQWGGVHYLFVRGMRPQTGPTRGVWSMRPDTALLQALGEVLSAGTSGEHA